MRTGESPARQSVVRRKEGAECERRLDRLAVAVLTALGEGDAAVRDAESRVEKRGGR